MAKKSLKDYTAFGNITAAFVLKNLPFLLFLGFLVLFYIANAHYAEKKIREIQVKQKEIKHLRWQYMSIKTENMYNTKQSELVKNVESSELRISNVKPRKIIIKK